MLNSAKTKFYTSSKHECKFWEIQMSFSSSRNLNWVKVTQGLLLLNALLWLVFSVWFYFRFANTQNPVATGVVAILMLSNTVIFLGIAWGFGKRLKLVYYFALLFLTIHLILTLTDEFGIYDLLVLLIVAFTITILVVKRKLFT